MPIAEQLTPPIAEHGEGPVWDATSERMLCVDLEVGDVLSLPPTAGSDTSEVRRVHVDAAVGVLRPRTQGGWVFGLQRRMGLLDTEIGGLLEGTASVRELPTLWDDTNHRMNDGNCDPQGRFFCGSMAYDESPGAGQLWRLDPDGTARIVIPDVSISNGLGWSPDGSRAYFNDTPTRRVDVLLFDVDTGNLLSREPFVTVPDGPGMPDGLTVDADGGVWVALWGGGAILRYDPDGTLSERVEVPTPRTTAAAFGGPGLRTLHITTSQRGIDTSTDHAAGAVFVYEPGVTGMAPLPFAG